MAGLNGSQPMRHMDGYCRNENLDRMSEDFLYHFALGTRTHDFPQMFNGVKFVCMGGSPQRMERFAGHLLAEMGFRLPAGQGITNIACDTDRFAMYKVGPVLAVSHGMGVPSISIMLHELVKLMDHAGCKDVTFIRIGTSGGLGIKPGTVVITDDVVDGLFRSQQELLVMGKVVLRDAKLDQELVNELCDCAKKFDDFETIRGKTMCTNDFYEEQGRIDGAICEFTEKEKHDFLREAYSKGVRNIEMESICFAAFCHHLKIKGAVMAVTLVDRFAEDQPCSTTETRKEWELRLVRILSRFIVKKMKEQKLSPICSCLVRPMDANSRRGSAKS